MNLHTIFLENDSLIYVLVAVMLMLAFAIVFTYRRLIRKLT